MSCSRRTLKAMLVVVLGVLGACTKDPEKDAHLIKAEELFAASNFKAAGPEYELSLTANPSKDIEVWKQAAYSFVQAGNFDKAAELLLKTVDLAPTTEAKVEVYTNVAGIYLQSANKPEKAEPYLLEALKLDPKNEGTLNWLGEVASQRGGARFGTASAVPEQLDVALARYDQLLQLNPKKIDAWAAKRIVVVKYLAGLEGNATLVGGGMDVSAKKAKAEKLHALLEESNKQISELSKAAAKKTGQ